MYSVQQLQALDYLLKRITSNNLKLVIKLNDQYWCGDFVQLDGNAAFQYFIDSIGDIERRTFYLDSPNAPDILKKIWQAYESTIKSLWSNPFKKLDRLPLLFEALVNILDKADIADEDSPFSPFLFNARSLNGNASLPFIYLGDEKLKLVSLIQIAEK